MKNSSLHNQILHIQDTSEFDRLALEILRYQSISNELYKNYLHALKIAPHELKSSLNIPFLPIEFFKNYAVKSGEFDPEITFTSSATTGTGQSRHHIKNLSWYEAFFLKSFQSFYGEPSDYCILGLLPSYLERSGSSVIYMVNRLIEMSGNKASGFFLYNHETLAETIAAQECKGSRTLLIGVTFALLNFAEKHGMPLGHTIIMETGGMKGRGEELTREEVTEKLKTAFGLSVIHSEYGMTELMSQAYSKGNGRFLCPPWMKVFVRDPSDPLSTMHSGTGALNVIDLANMDSCAFIATHDLGKVYDDGSFEVTGRLDRSDIRGCNLLVY